MEQTLVIFKPSAVSRALVGRIMSRFEQKGLQIAGLKMMRLSEELLREHYAHLVNRPFFPEVIASMTATPVIVMALRGVDAINVVRHMTGPTNGRDAAPGTVRGDFAMSNQENIIHASSSPEDADVEIRRFFHPDELFDYSLPLAGFVYSIFEK